MTNRILPLLLFVFVAPACFALDFTAGLGKNKELLLFSKCEMKDWGADRKLPGRPGPNDKLRLVGSSTLDFDTEANIGILDIWSGTVSATNKNNLKLNKELQFIVPGLNNEGVLSLKKSKMTCNGGVRISCHGGSRTLGKCVISLEDSTFLINRNFVSAFPLDGNAGFFNNMGKRGGIELDLKGKSLMEIGGSLAHDLQLIDNPKDLTFTVRLSEQNGNIPLLRFEKAANLAPVDVEIELKNAPGKGTYSLIEMDYRRQKLEKFRSLKLNGRPYTLGEKFDLGGKTAAIKIAAAKSPTSKDRSTANDLVLEVK